MYKCKDCRKEFRVPKKIFEKHGQQNAPFEELLVCPFCNSHLFFKAENRYCHYCGIRVRSGRDYCSAECEQKGIKAYRAQAERKEKLSRNPLMVAIREVEAYNKATGKRLSYGEYIAGRR